MKLDIKVKNEKTILKLKQVEKNYSRVTFKAVQDATIFLEGQIVRNLTAGKFGVKTRTNRLRGSISHRFLATKGNRIRAIVGSDVIYARIQEIGGKINVSQRMAGFAWHRFKDTGEGMWKAIALKKGQQITIPPHYYMRNTMFENQTRLRDMMVRGMTKDAFR